MKRLTKMVLFALVVVSLLSLTYAAVLLGARDQGGPGAAKPPELRSADSGKEQSQHMELAGRQQADVRLDKDTGVPDTLTGNIDVPKVEPKQAFVAFLDSNRGLYRIKDPGQELVAAREEKDPQGNDHLHMNQTYNGVPVYGGELAAHFSSDGKLTMVNGYYVPDIDVSVDPDVSNDAAGKIAQADMGKGEVSTADPSGLVILTSKGRDARLTWKITIASDTPQAKEVYFVDAHNGDIVSKYDALENAKYRQTYTANNTTILPGWLLISEGGSSTDSVAQATHNNAGTSYDYYYNTFGRDSFNNAGATITSTVHYDINYNNAFWNGNQLVFGDGDGYTFSPLGVALDVVGHEFTHAVTQYTANLAYSYQSGALNESYSDVFGELIEKYGKGSNDWLIGEDVYTPGTPGDALRSMSNPPQYGQPEDMVNYVNTSSDNGGVHTNSGIPNKAAYNIGSDVGTSKLQQIYYRTLTSYLTSSAQFTDARDATVQAASSLYGASSPEVAAVRKDFAKVGIGVLPFDTINSNAYTVDAGQGTWTYNSQGKITINGEGSLGTAVVSNLSAAGTYLTAEGKVTSYDTTGFAGYYFKRSATDGYNKHFAVYLGPNYVRLHRMGYTGATDVDNNNFTRVSGHEYDIRVVQADTNIKVFVDGQLYIDNTDTQNLNYADQGNLAVRVGNTYASFSDLSAGSYHVDSGQGTWTANSQGQLASNAVGSSGTAVANFSATGAYLTVESKVTSNDNTGFAGFHFRRSATDGYNKHFGVFLGPNYVKLHRMGFTGATDVTSTSFSRVAGHEYNVRVVQANDNIKVFVDGTLYIDNTDAQNLNFADQGGLAYRISDTNSSFGDIKAWGYHVDSGQGTWTANNAGQIAANTAAGAAVANFTSAGSYLSAEGLVTSFDSNGFAGFHFRRSVTDGYNKHFGVFLGPNYVKLHRMGFTGATDVTSGTSFSRVAGHEYDVRVVQANDNIKVFVDGTLYIDNTDAQNLNFADQGGLALRTSNTSVAYGGTDSP